MSSLSSTPLHTSQMYYIPYSFSTDPRRFCEQSLAAFKDTSEKIERMAEKIFREQVKRGEAEFEGFLFLEDSSKIEIFYSSGHDDGVTSCDVNIAKEKDLNLLRNHRVNVWMLSIAYKIYLPQFSSSTVKAELKSALKEAQNQKRDGIEVESSFLDKSKWKRLGLILSARYMDESGLSNCDHFALLNTRLNRIFKGRFDLVRNVGDMEL